MNPISEAVKLVLITLSRYVVVAACGWLVHKGIMDSNTVNLLENPILYVAIAGALITALTGAYLRLKSRFNTNTALKMPTNSTTADLNAVLQKTSVGQIISTAAPTSSQIRNAIVNS